jgi:hypothetical protein
MCWILGASTLAQELVAMDLLDLIDFLDEFGQTFVASDGRSELSIETNDYSSNKKLSSSRNGSK